MSTVRYCPRPGTYAAAAISALRAAGPSAWIPSSTLAERIQCEITSLRNLLESAVMAGLIEMRREGSMNTYRIGVDPDEESPSMPVRSVFEMGQPVKAPAMVSAPAPAQFSVPLPGARFGVFSDGEIAIERNGRVTERITPDEAKSLARVITGKVYEEDQS